MDVRNKEASMSRMERAEGVGGWARRWEMSQEILMGAHQAGTCKGQEGVWILFQVRS